MSPGAKQLYKEWYDKLSEQKNNGGSKAHKKFVSSPIEELPSLQREIYDELPQSFDTKKGVEIATDHGMAQRTFKRWLSTSMFKKISYGYYEKRYR